ncbi:substrate-binding domain-containing protein [Streptomyces albus]|uniref:substrate-binding domain-containing protein n=1 Tax=Streptomyces albus TaxID=1888 RepID=UPI000AE15C6B|nr:substrate-binding domain-containing protein [Streptomyces albus]
MAEHGPVRARPPDGADGGRESRAGGRPDTRPDTRPDGSPDARRDRRPDGRADRRPDRPAAGRYDGGRLTLGLVTANIHLGVGATLWSGVLAAADRNDVNLVCLPGGPLRPGGGPRNALYELIGPDRLDGVICWTSTLGLPAASDRAGRLARRLGGLPVVSLNRGLDGHETLHLDNHAGMRDAVGHLVGHHGRRRLACIRGPLANPVSLDRYRAYAHALARHRLRLDRSLVSAAADFGSGAGASAMRVLLDIRGLRPGRDFDAVVACSDVLAADALRFLTGRGVRVPEDVAVISFNDSPEARLSDPPLTSVALPFAELGELAVDTLLARLRGTRPPARSVVPGTLVTRRSCGCPSPLVTQGTDTPPDPEAPEVPPARVFAGLPGAGPELAAALRHGSAAGAGFLPLLERLIGSEVRTSEDAAAWDAALLRARALLTAGAPPVDAARVERLVGQARLMVADKSGRLLEGERWAEEQESRRLRELGTALTTAVDLDALTGALSRHLPPIGVAGCRLVLYEDGASVFTPARTAPGAPAAAPFGPAGPPDLSRPARAVLTREERDASVAPRPGTGSDAGSGTESGTETVAGPDGGLPADTPYRAELLLPDQLLPPGDRRWTLVAEPLHIGDEQLGFALFDAGGRRGTAHRDGALYRALGDQISAALKGIRLFDEVRRARDAAEQANRLKTRLLDNATDELRTPVEAILHHTRPEPPPVPPESPPEPPPAPGAPRAGARTEDASEEPARAAPAGNGPPYRSGSGSGSGAGFEPEPHLWAGAAQNRAAAGTGAGGRVSSGSPSGSPALPALPGPDERLAERTDALRTAHEHAGRLLRLIDDLLDLSRSEIDALDLSRHLLDPRPLLAEVFDTAARARPGGEGWRLRLPGRLPAISADGPRLRQILLNLLNAAADGPADGAFRAPADGPRPHPGPHPGPHSGRGPGSGPRSGPGPGPGAVRLTLEAEVRPPLLRVLITRPEPAPPAAGAEDLFQPFASGAPGMRLGLAIARRLAVLHGGSVTARTDSGRYGFRLELPLPTPADAPGAAPAPAPGGGPDGRTLLVAAAGAPSREIAAVARRCGLYPRRLHPDDDIASLVAGHGLRHVHPGAGPGVGHGVGLDPGGNPVPAPVPGHGSGGNPSPGPAPGPAPLPAAVAWDTDRPGPQEWSAVQRLHDHPALRHTPFLLYGPVAGRDLAEALRTLRPPGLADPVVVVDGDAASRERFRRLLGGALPGHPVRTAADGTAALALFAEDVPCLLVVPREPADMDGFDIVERMYEIASQERGREGGQEQPAVPVLMLSDRGFTRDDVRRAEPHPALMLLGRDILTEEETAGLLTRMTRRGDPGAHRAHAPVRHALAYIEQHYRRPLSRRQMARAAGVSENHLGRLFHRELGLTLWDYLTRLRVQRAKERLRQSDDSVQTIARAVGFHDRAYFSRVFRKVTGVAPHVYREASAAPHAGRDAPGARPGAGARPRPAPAVTPSGTSGPRR